MGEKLEREKIQASKHTRERECKEGECSRGRVKGRGRVQQGGEGRVVVPQVQVFILVLLPIV